MSRSETRRHTDRPRQHDRDRARHPRPADRSLQFLHVPAPKHRDGDGRRIAAASRFAPNFGIATECGWGRGDPTHAPGLLDSRGIAFACAHLVGSLPCHGP